MFWVLEVRCGYHYHFRKIIRKSVGGHCWSCLRTFGKMPCSWKETVKKHHNELCSQTPKIEIFQLFIEYCLKKCLKQMLFRYCLKGLFLIQWPFSQGFLKRGKRTMTTRTVTARKKWTLSIMLREWTHVYSFLIYLLK